MQRLFLRSEWLRLLYYSGNIHPAYSRMDVFSACLSDHCICLRYSLGDICMILIKYRLKLDTEWNPTLSEISRMESSVPRSRLQDFMIRVLLRKSSGEVPMISWKTRRK